MNPLTGRERKALDAITLIAPTYRSQPSDEPQWGKYHRSAMRTTALSAPAANIKVSGKGIAAVQRRIIHRADEHSNKMLRAEGGNRSRGAYMNALRLLYRKKLESKEAS